VFLNVETEEVRPDFPSSEQAEADGTPGADAQEIRVIFQTLLDAGLGCELDFETNAATKKRCREFVLRHHPDKKATETDEESRFFKLHLSLFQRLVLVRERAAAGHLGAATPARCHLKEPL
jgi:hypothetical protein